DAHVGRSLSPHDALDGGPVLPQLLQVRDRGARVGPPLPDGAAQSNEPLTSFLLGWAVHRLPHAVQTPDLAAPTAVTPPVHGSFAAASHRRKCMSSCAQVWQSVPVK